MARLVREERAALTVDMQRSLVAVIGEGREDAIAVIDHTLWRMAQGAVVLILLLGIVQYVVLVRFFRRRGPSSAAG